MVINTAKSILNSSKDINYYLNLESKYFSYNPSVFSKSFIFLKYIGSSGVMQLLLKISTKLKIAINTLVRSSFSRMILKNKHYHGNIFDEVLSIIMPKQPYALTRFFQMVYNKKILVHSLIALLVLANKLPNSALLLHIPGLLVIHGVL
jgi:hypothetical protein